MLTWYNILQYNTVSSRKSDECEGGVHSREVESVWEQLSQEKAQDEEVYQSCYWSREEKRHSG